LAEQHARRDNRPGGHRERVLWQRDREIGSQCWALLDAIKSRQSTLAYYFEHGAAAAAAFSTEPLEQPIH
jgi:hypothetical protein